MGHTHTCRQQQALLTAEAAGDTQVYYRTSLTAEEDQCL